MSKFSSDITTMHTQPVPIEEAAAQTPEGVTIENDPVMGYLFMLLVSTIYWMRANHGERPLIPQALEEDMIKALYQGGEFCKFYGLGQGNYHKYFDWLLAQKAPDKGGELDGLLMQHLDDLKKVMLHIKRDSSVSRLELDVLNAFRSWHNNMESASAIDVIRKKIGLIPAIPKTAIVFLRAKVDDATADIEAAKELVFKLTGKKGSTHVSMVDIPALRENKPELWKEYLAVKKRLTQVYKSTLMNHVRDNGGIPLDVEGVRKHFNDLGIPHGLPPKTFKGKIDDVGTLYTTGGKKLKSTAIAHDAVVTPNPKYDPAKDAVGGEKDLNFYMQVTLPTKNADGEHNVQYIYTQEKADANRAAKFQLVKEMLGKEKQMVANWRKDLMRIRGAAPGEELWERKVLAAMCEITYLTAIRVGGKGNKNLTGDTYGLSTLKVGWVKRRGESIILDYVGKKSVQQTHKIAPAAPPEKQVINVINALAEGKRRTEDLWTYGRAVYSAAKLNAYLKEVSGLNDATIHKVRHLRGTGITLQILPGIAEALHKKRGGVNQSIVDKEFKLAMTKVGKLLGHVKGVDGGQTIQWSTAANSYVDPSVMKDFYEQFSDSGVRPPTWLTKLI